MLIQNKKLLQKSKTNKMTMRLLILFSIFFIIFYSCADSQEKQVNIENDIVKDTILDNQEAQYSDDDVRIVENILQKALRDNMFDNDINDIVIWVGKKFLDTEYVGGVLDENDNEILTINLQELDCLTFVETCSVLARLVKQKELTFDKYLPTLKKIRYRNGEVSGYLSRIHYFSDWLYENEKSGYMKRLSKEIANTKIDNNVFFMSKNSDKYIHLDNDSLIEGSKKIEDEISKREYYYIPENEIDKHKDKIKNGYIIGITTNVEGLDIAHTGIAIYKGKELHLLHASSKGKKVEISEKTLQKMLNDNKIQTGIMIAKLNE